MLAAVRSPKRAAVTRGRLALELDCVNRKRVVRRHVVYAGTSTAGVLKPDGGITHRLNGADLIPLRKFFTPVYEEAADDAVHVAESQHHLVDLVRHAEDPIPAGDPA